VFFYMAIYMRKSTWSVLLVLSKILSLFVGFKIRYMVPNKIPFIYFVKDSLLVCRLRNSLYGPKQDPIYLWKYGHLFDCFRSLYHCHFDPTIYSKKKGVDLLFMFLCVWFNFHKQWFHNLECSTSIDGVV